MDIQSFYLPSNPVSEIRQYCLHIVQTDLCDKTSTFVSLELSDKDGNRFKSDAFELSDDKLSMPEHLDIIKRKVLDDISKQIEQKKLTDRFSDDDTIDINHDLDLLPADTQKIRKRRKKTKSE